LAKLCWRFNDRDRSEGGNPLISFAFMSFIAAPQALRWVRIVR
jgi:hypothetical protein